MVKNGNEDSMNPWRIITPVLLMILSGIMTWSGFAMQNYLGQIVNTVNEVRIDLKNYVKESTENIHDIDKRVEAIEIKMNGDVKNKRLSSLY